MTFLDLVATNGLAADENAPLRPEKPCKGLELRLNFPWLLVQAESGSALLV